MASITTTLCIYHALRMCRAHRTALRTNRRLPWTVGAFGAVDPAAGLREHQLKLVELRRARQSMGRA